MNTTITNDGFVWYILESDTARDLYHNIDFNGYLIFPDEVQLQRTDYPFAILDSMPVAIELGHEAELKSDWQEATARNNETRTFEAWLQDKAESLIN